MKYRLEEIYTMLQFTRLATTCWKLETRNELVNFFATNKKLDNNDMVKGQIRDNLNMWESIMRSDKKEMLANGLVFIGKSYFGLAEPAEPSQGLCPYTSKVPPDLTE